jgi:CMP-N-acetylneuraminic acid synthetase
MWEPNKDGFLEISKTTNKIIHRRQDAPIVYTIVGLGVYQTKKFLKIRKCQAGKMLPYEITKEHSHMIDFEFDFKVAELLLKNG